MSMKLERYYLVRRDHREFIGPMLIDEFKLRLERMDFGLQDELSGHCGPWVVLDHKDDVTKHYPDVASALGESLSLSWREATGHARVISRQDSRRDRKKSKPAKQAHAESRNGFNDFLNEQKKKSRRMQFAAVGIVLIALAAAYWMLSRKDEVPIAAEYSALIGKPDPSDFLNAMGMKVIPYPQKYLKTAKHQSQWLPLFRMYAFYTTGSIEGVSQKLLKGDQPASAPIDCSVETWKQKWRENASQLAPFIQGKALNKNQWTKILSLDPNWVRRRSAKGWVKPRNFFEGCLLTASVAIRSISGDPQFGVDSKDVMTEDLVSLVARRLQHQLEVLANGRTVSSMDRSSMLGEMTCLESAASLQDLDSCRSASEFALRPLMDEKYALALVRIATLQQQGNVDPRIVAQIPGSLIKISGEDLMSRIDITPEYRLLGYLTNGGSIEQALNKVDQEYSDVKFR